MFILAIWKTELVTSIIWYLLSVIFTFLLYHLRLKFQVLSEKGAHVTYKCTTTYNAQVEFGVNPFDPELAIDWRISDPCKLIISDRDRSHQNLKYLSLKKEWMFVFLYFTSLENIFRNSLESLANRNKFSYNNEFDSEYKITDFFLDLPY